MMATLRCDHPDIEEYISAKQDPRELRHFNLSVQVSDAFMEAVQHDTDWALAFPADELGDHLAEGESVQRRWTGKSAPTPCRVLKRVRARDLWDKIMRATYDYAEPGVLFVDRINRLNNLWYREHITATNPCGELPLPPYGACDLGAINLTRFVREPFTADAHLDLAGVRETATIATRMMDNVIDLSQFPLLQQAEQARGVRRLGLGLTGLADALIMLGLNYADQEARALAAGVMQTICHTAYQTSIALAAEKGSFPWLDREKHLQGDFIRTLPEEIRAGIAHRGIRNSHLTTIAPTGTISLLANNVSSGIEPVYDFAYTRRVLEVDGRYVPYSLTDYAYALWQELRESPPPPYFVDAGTLAPIAHLDMQAALQPYVDSAISKTINIPEHYPFDDFRSLYELAFDKGLKGCTTFRPNPITGAVLAPEETAQDTRAPHCCSIEREAD
jgi:ribonucleoside-diphosphate reductase alpha chain